MHLALLMPLVVCIEVALLSADKIHRLSMLALVPFTGSEPADGKICRAAMQVAVDAVNAGETPILNNYKVEIDYHDEGALGTKAPTKLMSFLSSTAAEQGVSLAPAIVGTYYICQTTSGIVRQFNMVQFATWCAGTVFTGNRVRFPNLYRRVTPQENQFAPQIFLAKSIARWKRVGIVFYPGNISEFLAAKFLYELMEKAGITISWFESVIDFDSSLIESLNESRTRVIYLGFYESPRVIAFLCLAFREGIRAPKFIFVAFTNAYTDPANGSAEGLNLPNDCTMEMIVEQMKAVYWVGNAEAIHFAGNKNTSLGYDAVEFHRRLDLLTNSSRSPDYARRLNCHDAMAHALVSLDAAEQRLKREFNLTLKDFSQYPEIVMNAVNQSAAYVNYEGVQHRLMYSDNRLESDQRFQAITRWQERDSKLHLYYRMWYQSGRSDRLTDLNMYTIQKDEDLIWPTKTNKPTNDLSVIEHHYAKDDDSTMYPVVAVAIVLFLAELAAFFFDFIKPNPKTTSFLQKRGVTDCLCMRLPFLLGALCLNISAVTFAAPLSIHVCSLQAISTTLGVGLISSTLCAKLLRLQLFSNVASRGLTRKQFVEIVGMREKQTVTKTYLRFAIVLFNTFLGALLAGWLSRDGSMKAIFETTPIVFDLDRDTYFDVSYETCDGPDYPSWNFSLIAINALPLIGSIILSYEMRHATKSAPGYFLKEANLLRIATVIAVTFYGLIIVIALIVKNEMIRHLCWTIFVLLFSVSTFALSLAPRYLIPDVERRSSRLDRIAALCNNSANTTRVTVTTTRSNNTTPTQDQLLEKRGKNNRSTSLPPARGVRLPTIVSGYLQFTG